MDIVTLPALPGSADFAQAFKTMSDRRVSACVVYVGSENYLLDLNKVIEIEREWATVPTSLGFVTSHESLIAVQGLADPWLGTTRGLLAGEDWLDSRAVRFALLDTDGTIAKILTRFERGAQPLAAWPVVYECNGTPRHRWTADQLHGAMVCPSLLHPEPKPSLTQI